MKKGLLGTIGCLSLVALLASCTSADEKQLKEDLAGKSNEEVVDYVTQKAVSSTAENMKESEGVKFELKEDANIELSYIKSTQGYSINSKINADVEAEADFILNYEKGMSIEASLVATYSVASDVSYNGITQNSRAKEKIKANVSTVYDKAEDAAYIYYKVEYTENSQTSSQENKIKVTNVLSNIKDELPGDLPDVTLPETSLPQVTLPEEYQAVIDSISQFLSEYKSLITFEVDDDQVKLCYSLTKEDLVKILDEFMDEIDSSAISSYISFEDIVNDESFKFNNELKVGFNKDYLLSSLKFKFDVAYNKNGLKLDAENDTEFEAEYGKFTYDDVSDKDSYEESDDIDLPDFGSLI